MINAVSVYRSSEPRNSKWVTCRPCRSLHGSVRVAFSRGPSTSSSNHLRRGWVYHQAPEPPVLEECQWDQRYFWSHRVYLGYSLVPSPTLKKGLVQYSPVWWSAWQIKWEFTDSDSSESCDSGHTVVMLLALWISSCGLDAWFCSHRSKRPDMGTWKPAYMPGALKPILLKPQEDFPGSNHLRRD